MAAIPQMTGRVVFRVDPVVMPLWYDIIFDGDDGGNDDDFGERDFGDENDDDAYQILAMYASLEESRIR